MGRVTFEEVRAFTLSELWELPTEVTEQTALAHDFGVAGLDGKEFMEKFATQFGVRLDDFDWVEYFGAEGLSPIFPIGLAVYLWQRYVQRVPARDLEGLPELTLGHLVECANSGRWQSPGSVPSTPTSGGRVELG